MGQTFNDQYDDVPFRRMSSGAFSAARRPDVLAVREKDHRSPGWLYRPQSLSRAVPVMNTLFMISGGI
jgi:hypothetical protein